jgi:excisionase family DNA binding protein
MDTTSDMGPEAGNERLVYSVAEAGALLGISRAFAYELVARGELPVIRLGRRRLVPKAALIAFIGLEPANQAGAAGSESAIVDVHKGIHTPAQGLAGS